MAAKLAKPLLLDIGGGGHFKCAFFLVGKRSLGVGIGLPNPKGPCYETTIGPREDAKPACTAWAARVLHLRGGTVHKGQNHSRQGFLQKSCWFIL